MSDASRPLLGVVEHESSVVVTVHGDIDASVAREFRAALTGAAATGKPHLVIDLAEVTFLDSAALAVVFGLRRALPAGQVVSLAHVRPRVMRVLRTAAVTSVVEVHAQGEPWPWSDVPEPGAGGRTGDE